MIGGLTLIALGLVAMMNIDSLWQLHLTWGVLVGIVTGALRMCSRRRRAALVRQTSRAGCGIDGRGIRHRSIGVSADDESRSRRSADGAAPRAISGAGFSSIVRPTKP